MSTEEEKSEEYEIRDRCIIELINKKEEKGEIYIERGSGYIGVEE